MRTTTTLKPLFVKFDGSIVYVYDAKDFELSDANKHAVDLESVDFSKHFFQSVNDDNGSINPYINHLLKDDTTVIDGNKMIIYNEYHIKVLRDKF